MESVIRDSLIKHTMDQNLFYYQQHGFVLGRSCMAQLLEVCIWSELTKGTWCSYIDLIYTDFWKSFDTVPRQKLLRKLKAYGVPGKLLEWIREFLSGPRQRVVFNGKLSSGQINPKQNLPTKCGRPYHVCCFHKWPARRSQEYNKMIYRWYEAVPYNSDNWRWRYTATRPRQPREMVIL